MMTMMTEVSIEFWSSTFKDHSQFASSRMDHATGADQRRGSMMLDSS